jgi:hypothetical protein
MKNLDDGWFLGGITLASEETGQQVQETGEK